MKHKKTLKLYNYWNELRGDNPAPKRSALDPQLISGLLGDLFILERKSPVNYTFRLAGTRLCSAYGRELREQSFPHFWSECDRESMETLLYSITEDAAAAVVGIQAQSAAGNSLPLEMLLLPLFQDNGKLTRVLGGLVPLESAYWIGVDPLVRQSIRSLRLIWPDKQPVLPTIPKKAVADQTPFGHARATRTAVNLKVIEGGLSTKHPKSSPG
jgi:hypothetical protein